MEIWINHKKIDFALEKEKNLFELIEGLEKFSQANKLLIYNLKKDDEVVINFHKNQSLKNALLKDIKKVSVEMLSEVSYTIFVLRDSTEYLDDFKVESYEDFLAKSDGLEAYLNYFKQALDYGQKILNLEKNFLVIKKNLRDLEIEFFLLKSKKKNFAEQELESLAQRMKHIISDSFFNFNIIVVKSTFADPDVGLQHKLTNFKILLQQLEKVLVDCSSNFQKNKTMEALKNFFEIISALELVLAFAQFLEKNVNFEEGNKTESFNSLKKYCEEIKSYLEALKQALENKDFVEMSDVLEYEVKEVIPGIIAEYDNLSA